MSCSLYVHIPYCNSKCLYCDFYSRQTPVDNLYIDTLVKRIPQTEFETAYIGGGTPSLLSCDQLKKLCEKINCSDEFTLEANPESFTAELVSTSLCYGINRLSFGVQSLNDKSLSAIGRRHNSKEAVEAIKLAAKNGIKNISADLMLGIPYQQEQDIDVFISVMSSLGVSHISCYMLKLEPGVPLYKDIATLPNSDRVADLYEYAVEKMKFEGYERYEFSNFARDNLYSRHNMRYWDCQNYLGIGPSAHSCINNNRFYYPDDIDSFIAKDETIPDGECTAEDFIMLSSRLSKGISLNELKIRFDYNFSMENLHLLKQYEKKGLLKMSADNITLTDRGLMVQNSLLASLNL